VKITPLDIQQQQFKGKMFRGLDQEDVDTFLQNVALEMEALIRENSSLKELVQRVQADTEALAQREKDLRDTLLAAQRVTEELKTSAQKQADLIVAEAELQADRITADAENRLIQLNNELQELRRQKVQFEAGFRALLDSHGKMLSVDEG
jgi:cell division initiation protein